jgi:NAD(P)-dependent dehydrogenase (short-subunit alcohol dehydrogenase family)
MDLQDKIALVTGGGSGIGLGIATALARKGCRVAIAGRNEEKLRFAAAEYDGQPPMLTRACDMADRAAVNSLFDWLEAELGPLDILVNSAGINVPNRAITEVQPDDWDRMLAINATGAFNCIYAALPGMRKRRSGLIVNSSSIAGKRAMKLGGVGYCASKFAMTALGTTVSLEERASGIHVTNIYPGEVNTPILAQRPTPSPPEKLAQMLLPEDIAAMVVAVARLPARAVVPELVITPLYQEYS